MVAIVFPVIAATVTILALAEKGLEGLQTHRLFAALLIPGAAALWFWVMRYTSAAVTALRNRGQPITVEAEGIRFFGRQFPNSGTNSLLVEGKKVSLLDGDHVLAMAPIFFIKSRVLALNQ